MTAKFNLQFQDLIIDISNWVDDQDRKDDLDLIYEILENLYPFEIKISITPKNLFDSAEINILVTDSDAVVSFDIAKKIIIFTIDVDFYVNSKMKFSMDSYKDWIADDGNFGVPRLAFFFGIFSCSENYMISPIFS